MIITLTSASMTVAFLSISVYAARRSNTRLTNFKRSRLLFVKSPMARFNRSEVPVCANGSLNVSDQKRVNLWNVPIKSQSTNQSARTYWP